HHKRALEIIENIEDKQLIISEMIIYETLTILRKKNQNNEKVADVYNKLSELNVYEDVIYYQQALKQTLVNTIGFFDNLSYVVMMNNNITEIASFDKDFDIFNDIKRIY
ncbi:MAG: PIN domain-containing protein, partial [Methanobacteriaceae archaeon]